MNRYEWAVETYLHQRRIAFAKVRDSLKVQGLTGPLKNFDYLIELSTGGLLLEIKGRSFPTTGGGRWENWVTDDDIAALQEWQRVFRYTGLFVFVYWLRDDSKPGRSWTPFVHEQHRFGMVACTVDEYHRACKRRSEKWRTLTVPRAEFTVLVRPLAEWLPGSSSPTLFDSLK